MNTLLAIALVAYFIPTLVANTRRHNNQMAIIMLNLFAGWTFIGWVAALVWACTSDINKAPRRGWDRPTSIKENRPPPTESAASKAFGRFLDKLSDGGPSSRAQ